MDQGWIRDGSGMDQGWIRDGAGMDQGWIRDGSGMDQGWIRDGSGIDQGWIRDGSGMDQESTVPSVIWPNASGYTCVRTRISPCGNSCQRHGECSADTRTVICVTVHLGV